MDMDKYARIMDEFAQEYCDVKEEDIMKKVKSSKMRRLKPFLGAAACVVLIFLGTTVSAASGLLDVSGLFKKLFGSDEISNNLIEQGAVQELNLTAQNDKYTITFEGIVGDENTQYGVFKVVDHYGELGNPTLLKAEVIVLDKSKYDEGRLPEYISYPDGEFSVSDEEENTYYIKINRPSFYNPENDIYVSFEKLIAYYGNIEYKSANTPIVVKADRIEEIPVNMSFTYTPDRDAFPESALFDINRVFNTEYGEFTVTSLLASNYFTEIIITFPTNENILDVHDATSVWHKFDNDFIYEPLPKDADPDDFKVQDRNYKITYFTRRLHKNDIPRDFRYIITVKDPTLYMDGEVKIFVDGNEIKRLMNNSYRWVSGMDSEFTPTYWGNLIQFEPIDMRSAKSIEIRYKDQTIVVK